MARFNAVFFLYVKILIGVKSLAYRLYGLKYRILSQRLYAKAALGLHFRSTLYIV